MNLSLITLILASCSHLATNHQAATATADGAVKSATDVKTIDLFSFADPSSASQWQAVNHGVMGGRSKGRFRMTDEGHMQFYGDLSLENNGGFASVRSRGRQMGLKAGDEIVIRVKGDGRKYTFNLYTPDRRTAFSYRLEFKTLDGKWSESKLPLKQFTATSFGRQMPNMVLDPARVSGVGILLGDKKPGKFQLEIESIKVVRKRDQ